MEPWVMYGLDGRSKETIAAAVDVAGYRRFDAAESYGNSTDHLAEAVRGLPRNQVEVLYKFDLRDESREQTKERLRAVADKFGGRLDAAVIHNIDPANEAERRQLSEAWAALGELKLDRVVGSIGVSNVMEHHGPLLQELQAEGKELGRTYGGREVSGIDVVQASPPGSRTGSPDQSPRMAAAGGSGASTPKIGVVENEMAGLLVNDRLQTVIRDLGNADIRFYNVVEPLKDMDRYAERTGTGLKEPMMSPAGVHAVTETVSYLTNGTVAPVLTSGNLDRMTQNARDYRTDPTEGFQSAPQENQNVAANWARAYNAENLVVDRAARRDVPITLPGDLRERMEHLLDPRNAGRYRAEIVQQAGDREVRPNDVSNFLRDRGLLSAEERSLKVPARIGMKEEYRADWNLDRVMQTHLGPTNCDYEKAQRLTSAFLADKTTWRENWQAGHMSQIAVSADDFRRRHGSPASSASSSPRNSIAEAARAPSSPTKPVRR